MPAKRGVPWPGLLSGQAAGARSILELPLARHRASSTEGSDAGPDSLCQLAACLAGRGLCSGRPSVRAVGQPDYGYASPACERLLAAPGSVPSGLDPAPRNVPGRQRDDLGGVSSSSLTSGPTDDRRLRLSPARDGARVRTRLACWAAARANPWSAFRRRLRPPGRSADPRGDDPLGRSAMTQNPLTPCLGYAHLLARSELNDQQRKSSPDRASRSTPLTLIESLVPRRRRTVRAYIPHFTAVAGCPDRQGTLQDPRQMGENSSGQR